MHNRVCSKKFKASGSSSKNRNISSCDGSGGSENGIGGGAATTDGYTAAATDVDDGGGVGVRGSGENDDDVVNDATAVSTSNNTLSAVTRITSNSKPDIQDIIFTNARQQQQTHHHTNTAASAQKKEQPTTTALTVKNKTLKTITTSNEHGGAAKSVYSLIGNNIDMSDYSSNSKLRSPKNNLGFYVVNKINVLFSLTSTVFFEISKKGKSLFYYFMY